jgi:hypothetical protein
MSAHVIFVHDDPDFVEKLRERYGRQGIKWHIPGAERALRALETEHFEILITRVRFAIRQPNGAALARMARMKWPGTKVVFTATTDNVEYTEGLGARSLQPRSTLLSSSPRSPTYRPSKEQTLPFSSGVCGPDRIGHFRAARSKRLRRPDGACPRRLMLDFRVELGAEQKHYYRNPHPGHKPDDRAQRAISFVEAPKIRCIPREQRRSGKSSDGGKSTTPGDPLPARFRTARAVPVDQRQRYRDQH